MNIDTFWDQFAIEALEHTDIIESNLVAIESGTINPTMIAELFRSFHSIKGLAKSMDLKGIESLAHVSEDILGIIRDGRANFNEAITENLLQSVDNLKQLVQTSCENRSNIEAPQDLLSQLKLVHKTLCETQAAIQETIEQTNPSSSKANSYMEEKKEETPKATHIQEEFTPIISHDSDTVRYFLERIAEELKTCVLATAKTPAEEVKAIFQILIHSYTMMGFDTLHLTLNSALSLFENDKYEDYLIELTNVFIDLRRQRINDNELLIEKPTQSPLFMIECQNLSKIVLILSQKFESMAVLLKDKESLKRAQNICLQAGSALIDLFPEIPTDLFLEIERRLYVLSEENPFPFHDAHSDVIEGLKALHKLLSNPSSYEPTFISLLSDVCKKLEIQSMPEVKVSQQQQEQEQAAALKLEDIPTGFIESLDQDSIERLRSSAVEYPYAFVFLARLELSPEKSKEFLKYIQDKCEIITNRSVFINNISGFEFLILSKETKENFEGALSHIDPENKILIINQQACKQAQSLIGPLEPKNIEINQPSSLNSKPETTLPRQETHELVQHEIMNNISSSTQKSSPIATQSSVETLRVSGETLDKFMNDIGEMVLSCSHLNFTISNQEFKSAINDVRSLLQTIKVSNDSDTEQLDKVFKLLNTLDTHHHSIDESAAQIQSVLRYLQESALGLRVVPMEGVFKRLPRIVRDLSKLQEKKVNLIIEGQDVKIDKSMVDILVDPMIHMIRNSVDHGLEKPEDRKRNGKEETGTIRVVAHQQGNQAIIYIEDNGRGMDPQKIRSKAIEKGLLKGDENLSNDEIFQFIFHPGFSTAEEVTETSGRGVGMDVVKTNIMRLGGSISVNSFLGKGTKITLSMPLSAAIQEVLLVKSGSQVLGIPSRMVNEVIEIETQHLMTLKGHPAALLRGHFLPIRYLGHLLGFKDSLKSQMQNLTVVVLSDGKSTLGIHVDSILHRSELFIKDVHKHITSLPGIGGASILGDGRVVLVLEGDDILKLALKTKPQVYPFLIKPFHHHAANSSAGVAS